MLEMIAAGFIAHTLYHSTMEIIHSEDQTHHVSTTVVDNNNQWQFEVCNPCKE